MDAPSHGPVLIGWSPRLQAHLELQTRGGAYRHLPLRKAPEYFLASTGSSAIVVMPCKRNSDAARPHRATAAGDCRDVLSRI